MQYSRHKETKLLLYPRAMLLRFRKTNLTTGVEKPFCTKSKIMEEIVQKCQRKRDSVQNKQHIFEKSYLYSLKYLLFSNIKQSGVTGCYLETLSIKILCLGVQM